MPLLRRNPVLMVLARGMLCSVLLICAGVISTQASAATPMFAQRALQSSDTAQLDAPLTEYRALALDAGILRAKLNAAPAEFSGADPSLLDLPMPDGSELTFAVRRTQVMAPRLAAKFPQIRSFIAHA